MRNGYNLFKQFLGELDREYFVVMCLDVKNQPTAINTCHIGSLNASIVHPRKVMKTVILSNSASTLVLYNHRSGNLLESREDKILGACARYYLENTPQLYNNKM